MSTGWGRVLKVGEWCENIRVVGRYGSRLAPRRWGYLWITVVPNVTSWWALHRRWASKRDWRVYVCPRRCVRYIFKLRELGSIRVVIEDIIGSAFSRPSTLIPPRRNGDGGKARKVIHRFEAIKGFFSKVSNCRTRLASALSSCPCAYWDAISVVPKVCPQKRCMFAWSG
jgi:hypothetical protein